MALSVKRRTSAQVMILWFVVWSPTSGSVLTAQSLGPPPDSVSPSLSLPLLCFCALSLSLSLSLSLTHTNKSTFEQMGERQGERIPSRLNTGLDLMTERS